MELTQERLQVCYDGAMRAVLTALQPMSNEIAWAPHVTDIPLDLQNVFRDLLDRIDSSRTTEINLTQRQLDYITQAGDNAYMDYASKTAPSSARTIAIIEEATGEKVTIVEPEPEIPEAVLKAFSKTLCLCHLGGRASNTPCGIHLSEARRLIMDLWDNGWGGLRK